MTPATLRWIRCYRAEWRKCADALIRHGYGEDELEEQRHRLHIEHLGSDVSSKAMTMPQRDAILAAFRAYSRPGDLAEQLRIIDQPDQRGAAYRDRATALATALCDARGPDAYLEHLSRKVCGRPWSQLRETDLTKLCGILARAHARASR